MSLKMAFLIRIMFCPQCGAIQMPKKIEGKTIMMCANGHSAGAGNMKISEHISEKKDFEVVEESLQTLPIADDEKCPKCGNRKAYFYTKQTRAADEPETKFLKCTKCSHQWRDYK